MRIYGAAHAKEIALNAQSQRDRLMYNVLPKAGQVKAGRAEDIRKAAKDFDFRTCFNLLDPINKELASECFWKIGWDRHSSMLQPLMANLRDKILDVDWDSIEVGSYDVEEG